MATHPEFEELIPMYALGGLPDAERKRLQAHLAECPDCRALLLEEQAIVQTLPRGVTPVAPSPEAKLKLLARVDADLAAATEARPAAPARTVSAPHVKRSWFARPAFAFAALVILGVLALGLWLVLQNLPSSEQQQIAAILSNPNVQKVSLNGTPDAPGASGEIYMVPGQTQAVLRVNGLPPLPEDKRYEFWFIRGEDLQPSNLFTVNAAGTTTLLVKANETVENYNAWGVSIEPRAGVTKPTGPIVIFGGG